MSFEQRLTTEDGQLNTLLKPGYRRWKYVQCPPTYNSGLEIGHVIAASVPQIEICTVCCTTEQPATTSGIKALADSQREILSLR